MRHAAGLSMCLVFAVVACTEDQSTPFEVEIGSTPSFAKKQKDDLVEQGRILFFEETFGGNGRTCGSCHLESSFTITPEQIAQLPKNDLLFKGKLATPAAAPFTASFTWPGCSRPTRWSPSRATSMTGRSPTT